MEVSLRASTGLADFWADDDGSCPWVVTVVGGEHRFHPGWLDHAQYVAERLDVDVVALNDLTPQAQAGVRSTVHLVRGEFYRQGPRDWRRRAIVAGSYGAALGSVVELVP
jgi:hypothetical protein